VSSPQLQPFDQATAVRRLAELTVELGANVQPGQILTILCEPGKEPLARAIGEAAYQRGARFVDLDVFDLHLKRARVLHASESTLGFVPPWYGDRMRALGKHRCASVLIAGPAAPHALDGLDPERVGRDMLPRTAEWSEVLNARTINWSICACPTAGWAELVHPDLDPPAALARLWSQIAHVYRLDAADPAAAWGVRLDALARRASQLTELRLDALRFEGPETDLTVGLLPSSQWIEARYHTVDGIAHVANLPTEEIFTSPDPERVNGVVRATKPVYVAGVLVDGLQVRFEAGRAVSIEADRGAGALRTLTQRDDGGTRLGEVALVDREGRIGPLDTVFYDVLLDENAASHLALGNGFDFAVGKDDRQRINHSEIHIDFMVGSDEVTVTGLKDGLSIPLLANQAWQI